MTLIFTILSINTALFIILLINTAIISKRNERQLKAIKSDNQCRKYEVRELLQLLQKYSENSNLGIIAIKDLLHKNK